MKENLPTKEQYQGFIQKLNIFANYKFSSTYRGMTNVIMGTRTDILVELYERTHGEIMVPTKPKDSVTPAMLECYYTGIFYEWSYTNSYSSLFIPLRGLVDVDGENSSTAVLRRMLNNILIKQFAGKHTTYKLLVFDPYIGTNRTENLFPNLKEFFSNLILLPEGMHLNMYLIVFDSNHTGKKLIESHLKNNFEKFGNFLDKSEQQFTDLFRKFKLRIIDAKLSKHDSTLTWGIEEFELKKLIEKESGTCLYYKEDIAGPLHNFSEADLHIIRHLFKKALKFNEDLASALIATLAEGGLHAGCKYESILALKDKYSDLIRKDQLLKDAPKHSCEDPQISAIVAIEELCCRFWTRGIYSPKRKIALNEYLEKTYHYYFEKACYHLHTEYFKMALLQLRNIADHYKSVDLMEVYNLLEPLFNSQELIIKSFSSTLGRSSLDQPVKTMKKLYCIFIREVVSQYNDILENLQFDSFTNQDLVRPIIYRYMLNFSDNPKILLQIAKITFKSGKDNLGKLIILDHEHKLANCYFKLLMQDANHKFDWLYEAIGDVFFHKYSPLKEWKFNTEEDLSLYEKKVLAAKFYEVIHNYDKLVSCYEGLVRWCKAQENYGIVCGIHERYAPQRKASLKALADIHEKYGHYKKATETLIKVFGLTTEPEPRKAIAEQIVVCEKKRLLEEGNGNPQQPKERAPDYDLIDLSYFCNEKLDYINGPTYKMLLGGDVTEASSWG